MKEIVEGVFEKQVLEKDGKYMSLIKILGFLSYQQDVDGGQLLKLSGDPLVIGRK